MSMESMKKILCVEDDDDSAFMLKRRLQRRGFEVQVAVNGVEGISMAQSEKPDLILMDIDLPELDGLQATSRLKSDPATQAIPIIVLTAHAMKGDRENAINAGCDDFDTKPMNLPRLLEKIDRLLS